MSGCFGDSAEDRYMSGELYRHLDDCDESDDDEGDELEDENG
jgi:hypothetical protein